MGLWSLALPFTSYMGTDNLTSRSLNCLTWKMEIRVSLRGWRSKRPNTMFGTHCGPPAWRLSLLRFQGDRSEHVSEVAALFRTTLVWSLWNKPCSPWPICGAQGLYLAGVRLWTGEQLWTDLGWMHLLKIRFQCWLIHWPKLRPLQVFIVPCFVDEVRVAWNQPCQSSPSVRVLWKAGFPSSSFWQHSRWKRRQGTLQFSRAGPHACTAPLQLGCQVLHVETKNSAGPTAKRVLHWNGFRTKKGKFYFV